MDMNSDLPDFQTGRESQEVIPDHHCPLPTPAPDGSQIHQFMLLIHHVAQNHGKLQGDNVTLLIAPCARTCVKLNLLHVLSHLILITGF